MIRAVWGFLKPHLAYWIVIAVGLLGFRIWLQEHDARLLAQQLLKQSQDKIVQLQNERAQRDQAATQQKQVIIKEVQAAQTPQQQTDVIQKLATVPLHPVIVPPSTDLPDAPSAVKVDLGPLLEQLQTCKTDSIDLGACQADLRNADAIAMEKDNQIQILQKRPGFWHRFGGELKIIGCAAAGGAVGSQIKGNAGANAGMGAAGGAFLCSFL